MDKNVETALRFLKDPSYIPFLQRLKKTAVTTLVPPDLPLGQERSSPEDLPAGGRKYGSCGE